MARLHAQAFKPAWSAAALAGLLAHPGALALVAEDDGVRAFVLGRIAADEAEILTIVTDPGKRRQGQAAGLLAALETALVSCGAASLYLEVAADNKAATALYLRAGFAETGRRRAYYTRPDNQAVDALIMCKQLR